MAPGDVLHDDLIDLFTEADPMLLTQCWFIVGQASQTELNQHWVIIGQCI